MHAVRKARIGHERTVLQELGGQRRGTGVRHDLVAIAVQDEHGQVDRLQVLGEVGLR